MKIGYLPLYIKLYDEKGAKREPLLEFYEETTKMFEARGAEVVTAELCRIKPEFDAAVANFEKEQVDAIVTWHAAYSPSLESIEALAETKLPIIVFDSTPTLEFTPAQESSEISWNHGIHGVMDMCSMLTRYKKPYAIAAGHYRESDCMDRVLGFVRAAIAAKKLDGMKVGLIGGGFDGMGDFAVEPKELKERFGISVETVAPKALEETRKSVTKEDVASEIALEKAKYDFDDNVVMEEYEGFVSCCLSLRKFIEEKGYNAFSVNFLNVEGLGTMPFTECCKQMEKGTGYAGEGDALTAAFTGAFLSSYPETSFVEIFCPDWKNNTVFMSHMGEMNYRITGSKPLITRTGSPYVKGIMPYAGYARMKGGKGAYINISRDKDDYKMVIAPAQMLAVEEDNFRNKIRGWMQPENSNNTAQFLEKLSKNGATHHSTFVYGITVEEAEFFASLLSIKTVVI
ncbi:MAG: hypothetical protein IKB93_08375 [Clostridia bacterium]|nr:hypothetical protein [Clostridia bacterium]